jgi:hypothetical protein
VSSSTLGRFRYGYMCGSPPIPGASRFGRASATVYICAGTRTSGSAADLRGRRPRPSEGPQFAYSR